jgi:hypothetical protein
MGLGNRFCDNAPGTESGVIILKCPNCGNKITIINRWWPGGANDYGSFKLKCSKCGHVFTTRIGRDIDISEVSSGAELLETIEDK